MLLFTRDPGGRKELLDWGTATPISQHKKLVRFPNTRPQTSQVGGTCYGAQAKTNQKNLVSGHPTDPILYPTLHFFLFYPLAKNKQEKNKKVALSRGHKGH